MHIKKVSVILICLLFLTSSFHPVVPLGAYNETLTITTSDLNVREGPGLSYSVIAKAEQGESYSIVQQQGEWIEIVLSSGKKGWVAEWYTSKDEASSSSNTIGTVAADNLRVRSGPSTSYSVLGAVTNGEKVEIIKENGNWLKIQLSTMEGWVSKEYIQTNPNNPNDKGAEPATTSIQAVVTDNLNVRSKPSLQAKIVGKLPIGDRVTIHSYDGEWAQIRYQGSNAWVSKQYLNAADDHAQVSQQAEQSIGQATVTATSLNIRDKAALDGKVIGAVQKGETFDILEENNQWLKIKFAPGETGWAASWFFTKSSEANEPSKNNLNNQSVTILHDGSNIRSDAGVQSPVLQRANEGETFNVVELEGDWYKIQLSNGETGYVAGWIVSVGGTTEQIERPGTSFSTKNKTIIIDPGHGGKDVGTIGARGTLEKNVTLATATLLYDKLKASGANVYMTRHSDTYLSLASRVSASHYHQADAFISIHYDSTNDRNVRGITSYYYHDDALANALHPAIMNKTKLDDRDVRFGDYYVIRENRQNSALLELGFLSNPTEEMLVTSEHYQQTVATGIFEGIARYFEKN